MKTKYIWLILLLIGFTACENDDNSSSTPIVELSPGNADFTKYVAIGNSLTAGFSDAALFMATQENSFPNILAQQFALVGGGAFTQPLMSDNFGGMTLGGNRILQPRLVTTGGGPVPLESVIGPVMVGTEVSNILSGPFNNMGVPGARSYHLLANGYGNIAGLPNLANPYFVRMASNPNASVLEDALAQGPTFFSLWIGSNDVLGYALSGGDGSSDITDVPTFTGAYGAIVSALTQTGAQGVVANIPDVTTIPYFTAVAWNVLDPSDEDFADYAAQIPQLNGAYTPLNQAFAFLGVPERSITFSETDPSPVVIHDESLPNIAAQLSQVLQGGGLDPLTAGLLATQYGQARQATESDLLTLPSSAVIGTLNTDYFNTLVGLGVPPAQAGQLSVNGLTFPLSDTWVLLPSEQMDVKNAVDSFNSVIESAASSAGLAFVDAYTLQNQAVNGGFTSGDFTFTADLVTGGLFSLDGVHLTSRGYAAVANTMLQAIDLTYESNFDASGNLVNVGNYPTNYSPLLQ